MSCYRPIEAYRDRHGLVRLGLGGQFAVESFTLPCGRCIGCKLDRARSWAVRITHESQLYASNRFVTFTYSDENLPKSRSLEYRDFQLFMKRLRYHLEGAEEGPEGGRPLRFFCAGEYGSKRKRPHFHAVLFNLQPPDEQRLLNGSSRSKKLEEWWEKGTVRLDPVNARSAAYVAGYSLKKVYGSRSKTYYEDVVSKETGEVTRRRPEFVCMSLKPGIGFWWFKRFASDLFPHDFAVREAKRWKVPRYYWEHYRASGDASMIEELQYARYLRAVARREENTPERRAVREECANARVRVYHEREDL